MIHEFIDTAIQHYVTAGLWTTPDWPGNDQEPTGCLDAKYGPDDMSDEALASIREDVTAFIAANWRDVKALHPSAVGHDFLLTRDGHGAGFWDRGLGDLGDRLTDAAHPYGDSGFYAGDDGRIHVQ